MATFLELCRSVRMLSGIQGTGPSSTSVSTGIEAQIIRFVRDAYIDIQNTRDSYPFLESSKTFTTDISVDTYSLSTIFISTNPDLKKYKDDSFYITVGSDEVALRKSSVELLETKYLNDTRVDQPSEYAVDPKDNSLILKPTPDQNYTIRFKYWTNPEILSSDSQVPLLPLSFHQLIVYSALVKLAVGLSSPEVYREYSVKAEKMLGQLMRYSLPKKSIRLRPLA